MKDVVREEEEDSGGVFPVKRRRRRRRRRRRPVMSLRLVNHGVGEALEEVVRRRRSASLCFV